MSRAYGWQPDGVTVEETEATELRRMAEYLLGGGTLRGLVADLTERGVRTVTGASRWQPVIIKRALTNPRMIGKRATSDGELVDTDTAPILDDNTYRRLVELLTDPARARFAPTRTRVNLLSGGLARCGKCGSELYVNASGDRSDGYACATRSGGCGKIWISAAMLEADATERVLARLTDAVYRKQLREAMIEAGGPSVVLEELRTLRARLEALGEDFADGVIDRDTMAAGTRRLRENIARAEQRLQRAQVLDDLPEPSVDDVLAWWEAASNERRREVISVLVDHVTVAPAVRKAKAAVGSDRLRYTWREQ